MATLSKGRMATRGGSLAGPSRRGDILTMRPLSILLALLVTLPLDAQRSLAPPAASGETVTPVYEGWYRNKDGTVSMSFGYFNRNTTEVIEIPIGPSNTISPGVAGQEIGRAH